MSLLAFDLIRYEEGIKKNVKEFFKWEKFGDYDVETDWKAWSKMMGTGTTNKSASTRRCLDAKRRLNDCLLNGGSDGKGEEYGTKGFMGSRTLIGVKL